MVEITYSLFRSLIPSVNKNMSTVKCRHGLDQYRPIWNNINKNNHEFDFVVPFIYFMTFKNTCIMTTVPKWMIFITSGIKMSTTQAFNVANFVYKMLIVSVSWRVNAGNPPHSLWSYYEPASDKTVTYFKRHCHIHFLERKHLRFDSKFAEVSSNWQWYDIRSGNGLVPKRRQVIIWAWSSTACLIACSC